VIGLSVYTVDERELAIRFRLGKIIETDLAPGVHFKVPFINNVLKFPQADPDAYQSAGTVPDFRKEEPARRLLRQVANRQRRRVLPCNRWR
jgi:hypothetical protein